MFFYRTATVPKKERPAMAWAGQRDALLCLCHCRACRIADGRCTPYEKEGVACRGVQRGDGVISPALSIRFAVPERCFSARDRLYMQVMRRLVLSFPMHFIGHQSVFRMSLETDKKITLQYIRTMLH